MSPWTPSGPRNRGKFRTTTVPQPQVDDHASWRMCGCCGSRNPYVALYVNQDNVTRCAPSCSEALSWINQLKEVEK